MKNMITLNQCKENTRGIIVEISSTDRRILGKMMSLGIIPGTTFLLLRRSSGVIVQIGYTKVALDTELAMLIRIKQTL
ncbi:MAG: ferrous iron transport protein A [Clostridiales bacterium]|jgi:DtxR family Mn-dependent transcriptional regulator/ferrous iron transport protein A|nr:ferrous iron transport protein A [Clostridiales bacterium]